MSMTDPAELGLATWGKHLSKRGLRRTVVMVSRRANEMASKSDERMCTVARLWIPHHE
jgi:hypothetical protein